MSAAERMMKMRLLMSCAVIVAVFIMLMAGCGGGGDSDQVGPPPADGGSNTLEIGPLVVRTEKTAGFKAESIPCQSGCSFVALYGAQIQYLASTALLDRLVFVSNRSGHYNIYMCNLDGSGLTRLTNNLSMEEWPRWSPDGTKIAFSREWPGVNSAICTMNADGTGVTALTDTSVEHYHPDWSPTGGWIAYDADAGGQYDIFIMYSDGSHQTVVADSPEDEIMPALSPDNTSAAFATRVYGPVFEIAVASEGGSGATRLTDGDGDSYAPCWHPLGQLLCFHSWRFDNHEVYTMDREGNNLQNFTTCPDSDQFPRYGTDGRYITYTSYRSGNNEIWVQETSRGVRPLAAPMGPTRAWNVTQHGASDMHSDLGSPRVQTDRVLIGAPGSDRGYNPVFASAAATIVAFDGDGYRNLLRIGVATEHLAGMQVKPLVVSGSQLAGVEVSATKIANLREDAGWSVPATVWDFNALNVGMVLLHFNAYTGKLASATVVEDVAYSTGGTTPTAPYELSAEGEGVRLTGSFAAVFDAEGRNLASSGASGVTLGKAGEVLSVN